ncbi:MAG TPA: hypothetical protein VFZ79_20125 [Acidimicrobiales bacterium]
MTRRSRFVAITLVAVFGLAACANNDAKESDVVNAMRDAGLDPEQAECIGAGFEDAFGDDQELFNEVAGAAGPDDLPGETGDTVEAIFEDCGLEPVDGGGDTDTTDADDGADADTTDADADTTDDGATGDDTTTTTS